MSSAPRHREALITYTHPHVRTRTFTYVRGHRATTKPHRGTTTAPHQRPAVPETEEHV
ncbi:hypothetical protein STRAU_0691 [Streptomyces aurantiacus JA 4570]|uniref:Uncharacterized protein n=1 Tax=Streptomyces aurantiacus JA 4570 TaxID=1286094 RepID=S4A655_9ACTN|nr:hypothetical protein STRAU_0691 [Streptomyces aurantiacus JA 4570]